MSRKFLTSIDMGKNQFISPVMENLPSAPGTPVKGQMYFDTGGNILYWYNGSGWVAAQGGAGAVPSTTVTTSAVGDSAVVGVATTYAREDHKHAREAFAASVAATTFGLAKTDGSAVTLARSDHHHGTPTHDAAAHSTIPLSALAVPNAAVNFNGQVLNNVGAPSAGTDATNKTYVDNLAAGLSWKETCRIATTANVGQTGLAAIDGITPSANDRVLCKDQSTGSQNGIWLAQSGAWTRALDADAVGELEGAAVFVTEGTANGDKAFVNTTNGAVTPGTTATTWVQFGAGTAYTAGNGLLLSASTFDVVAANGSLTVGADDIQVGYAGTGTTFGSAVTAARSDHNHDTTYTRVATLDCLAALTTTVTHNFNTRDVAVHVYRLSTPWDTVDADVERPSVNTVDVKFATAPTAAQFRIMVVGRS